MKPANLGARIGAAFSLKRSFTRDDSGATAVEFALIVPFLLMLCVGTFQFGITINNYLELTDGVRAGGRQFAISRSSATPYSTSVAQVKSSAANLTAANVTVTTKINGTACASDATCSTALNAAAGGTATTIATYPCNLTVMGVNFAPSCTLTSTTSDMIE
ncbi:MAG TPA: TadE/TadG family type IV pilus assembly protein [Caulobacteraceae bacterium]|jgi:Flp pilus assembly protein TadG|nr:TadE/TadG family type IV pilus assembly protein [Caulobacteraceae bacterium]